ncbi:Calx-beta domain-containing protein, partial [Flavivirga amylovorans]
MKKITYLILIIIILTETVGFSQVLPQTLDFNTTSGTNLGILVNDGEGGSVDISGLQIDIVAIDGTGTPTGGDLSFYDFTSGYEGLDEGNGVDPWRGLSIKTNDGSEFDFNGFKASSNAVAVTFTIEGFKNAASTGTTSVNLDAGLLGAYDASNFSDAIFGDVDEIRIISDVGWSGTLDAFELGISTNSQTTLTTGDIAFVRYNGDGSPDDFSFILLKDIVSGTEITFTDKGWLASGGFRVDGSADCNSENTITWTAGSNLSIGTIVSIQGFTATILGVTNGTVSPNPGGCPDLSLTSGGEALFAYQGAAPSSVFAAAQTNFIAAINMNGGWDSDATSTSTSAKPAVFTDGVNSLAITPEQDNAVYTGSLSGDVNTLRANINNQTNWDRNNTTVYAVGDIGVSVSSPTVTTSTASLITTTGATLNGNVTSDGGAAITERGFVYALTSDDATPTVAEAGGGNVTKVIASGTTGSLSQSISSLIASGNYSFAAYAINSEGTTEGTIETFTTLNPTVAFTAAGSSGLESIASANLEVSLSAVSGSNVSVNYAVTGTATGGGTDYTLVDGVLNITAGNSSNNITIAGIVPDAILEANETVIVTLSTPTNATLGTNTIHTYTINNDDSAAVTIADVSGNENDGAITVTATLDNAVQGGFTVDVSTADGTATTADSDYSAVTSQTLTFTGNASETQTFTVTPTGDTKLETNETITVSQSNLAATTLGVNITDGATMTIINDDAAAVTIANVSGNENDGSITVTATLDNA